MRVLFLPFLHGHLIGLGDGSRSLAYGLWLWRAVDAAGGGVVVLAQTCPAAAERFPWQGYGTPCSRASLVALLPIHHPGSLLGSLVRWKRISLGWLTEPAPFLADGLVRGLAGSLGSAGSVG